MKILRNELGMSQEEFGKLVGLSKRSVQNIEQHVYGITEQLKRVICDLTNANRQWLDTGEGEMYATPETVGKAPTLTGRYAEAYNTDATFRALVDAYIALDNTERKIFQQVLEKFAEAVVDAKERGAEPPTVSDIAVQLQSNGLLTRLDDADNQ